MVRKNLKDDRQTEFVLDKDLNMLYIPSTNVFRLSRDELLEHIKIAQRRWLEVSLIALFDEWAELYWALDDRW